MIFGPFQFDRPWWLLLAPVTIVLSILIARKSLTGLSPVVHRVAMAIRIIALVLAAMALAEPSYRLQSDGVSVLVVDDQSRSMPSSSEKVLRTYLEQALQEAPPHSRLGYVTAAETARAHALPSARVSPLTQFQDVVKIGTLDPGPRDGTNLEEAARLALAIKPEDTAARIMMISDGNETDGSLLALAETARTSGVPIDVLPFTYSIDNEIKFDGLIAPPTARAGQTVNVRFSLTATKAAKVRLGLLLNGQPFDLTPGEEGTTWVADLLPGSNIIPVPVLLPRGGPQEFKAVVEPLDPATDTISQNNSAAAVTFVSTQGVVLVYTMDPAESLGFVTALEQSRLQVEVRNPGSGHESLVELQRYDAVILFDVPAGAFSRKQQDELAAFTRDSGGGLVMVGGPNSFGAGGWIGTPVADALPVRLDPPEKRQIPRGALALVMHSCEMPEGNYWGQKTAQAAVNALARLDLVGVLEYDHMTGARWVYDLKEKGDGTGVAAAIKSLTFGDMPDFDTAMQKGVDSLIPAKAGQKHMIIISDGDPSPPSSKLISQMIAAKISCSTVAVFPHGGRGFGGGGGSEVGTMKMIAEKTGGRLYVVNSTAGLGQLPEIFIKESQVVKRTLIWEGEAVRPTLVNAAAEPMRGISAALPPITGYVVTADREGLSLITAKGPNDDPIVAQWQFGLGRSVAFTSDAASRWGTAWLSWGQFRAFWDQHVRWAMRPSGSANLSITTETRGDSTRVVVTALDTTGDALNFARFQGRIVGPDGTAQNVELRQSGPGRYEGEFGSGTSGAYLVSLRYDAPKTDADGKPAGTESGTIQAAVTRPFADEHRALKDNAALLRQVADMTGGRVLSTNANTAELFSREGLKMPVASTPIWLPLALAAIGVFLTDVGVRRVRIDPIAIARATRRLFSRSKEKSPEQLSGLRAARETARTRMTERTQPAAGGESASSASVKFEASAEALSQAPRSPLDRASPEPPPDAGKADKPADAKADEEAGMSRLLQAKRRAQQNMKDDEDKKP